MIRKFGWNSIAVILILFTLAACGGGGSAGNVQAPVCQAGADTDADSLPDCDEVNIYHTSPLMADTDGDKYTDHEEVIGGMGNPLVAEVPKLKLEFVGSMDIQLNTVISESCSVKTGTVTSSLVSNTATQSETDTESIRESTKVTREAISWPGPLGKLISVVTPSVSTSEKSTVQENTTSWTQASSNSVQSGFQALKEQECFAGTETTNATITMGFKVKNTGPIAFTLSNLNVTVLHRNIADPSAFTSLATVQPVGVAGVTLAQGATTGTLTVTTTVPAPLAMALLAKPAGLMFEVASYDVLDGNGRNFAFINDTTLARTTLIVLDYGNGTVERHLVAAGVERNSDNSFKGVTLGRALQILGKTAVTAPNVDGVQKLVSLDGVSTSTIPNSFWLLFGNSTDLAAPGSGQASPVNFNDIKLTPKGYINLSLVQDDDGDWVFNSEEKLLGSSSSLTDTDGDGLSDFEEAKQGWNNGFFAATTKVYSSPTEVDTDGDGLSDLDERTRMTDPTSRDTDGDKRSDAVEVLVGRNPILAEASVLKVETGGTHTLALMVDGTIKAWGNNSYGQLGLGNTTAATTPTTVLGGNWMDIAVGYRYVVAVKKDGTLWAWGNNLDGGLGVNDTNVQYSSPTQIGSAADWAKVFSGGERTFAIKADGSLWAWGWNMYGQLGLGDTNAATHLVPTQVLPGSTWSSISAGLYHTMGIRTDGSLNGTLWGWGDNSFGRIGNGNTSGAVYAVPQQESSASNQWRNVAVGLFHSLGIKSDGTLWAWGKNDVSQLGLGDTVTRYQPNKVGTATIWELISASAVGSMATQTNGTLWSWGKNVSGATGQYMMICLPTCSASMLTKTAPTQVGTANLWNGGPPKMLGFYDAVTAANNWDVSYQIHLDGSLRGMGKNANNQLGLGTDIVDKIAPVLIVPY